MARIKRARPALVVAVLTLVAAVAGTALAGSGPSATTSKSAKKTAKQALKLAKKNRKAIKNIPAGEKGDKGDQGLPGPSTGPAGGDLTGTYPNPAIAPDAVDSSKVANDSLTGADLDESSLDTSGLGLAQGALLGRIRLLSAGAATQHGSPNGTSDAATAQADVYMISTSSPMTLSELRVFVPGGLPGGTTRTFTVTAFSDTAITCQVTSPNFGCSDLVNSATIQLGTTFSIKVVTTGSPGTQDALFSLRALSG